VYLARAGAAPWRALKVFTPPAGLPHAEQRGARERFVQEAQALRRLSHPAIVGIHAAGVDGDLCYLAMTLLPGHDLRRHTRPARLLPEPLVLGLGAEVADALAHAHARGVVHRDVKPANLMFDPSRRRVWLTDFGTARAADAEPTRTGLLLGTPAFMAPELLAGATADAACDVYALGATLFQLLTARLPHECESMGQLLHSIRNGTAVGLRDLRPDLPVTLDAAVGSALRLDRGSRPSAAALAAALRAAAAELPNSGRPG
jgi:serine/threonine-protein kinase